MLYLQFCMQLFFHKKKCIAGEIGVWHIQAVRMEKMKFTQRVYRIYLMCMRAPFMLKKGAAGNISIEGLGTMDVQEGQLHVP